MLQLDSAYSSRPSGTKPRSASESPPRVPDWATEHVKRHDSLDDDPTRLARLKRLQLELLAHHSTRLPLFVPLAAGFVGFTIWGAVSDALVLGWIAIISIILVVRWKFSSAAAKRPDDELDRALLTITALSFTNGLIQGGGAALFFPQLTLAQKSIVTMIMVTLSAGAVSANAGYSRAFYAWAVPMFAALSLAWALQGDVAGAWIAFLLVLFPVVQTLFVRDNERVLRESFDIRYRNEALIRELEVQRQAVASARDRAEEANRAKSRFLASASHDLRQPLHTLALYSAALGLRNTDERTRQLSREIGGAIQSLGALLDALLDISKLDAEAVRPEPTAFALNTLAERIKTDFAPIAEAKGLSLELEAGSPVIVETDPVLLERIVRNLVDNAIKYTARGGVRIDVSQTGPCAVLTVRDTGPGIAPQEQERVFEEFYQLSNPERDRSRGIGLGLAIVRRLTRLLGIELKLDSEPGKGTTLILELPALSARASPAQGSAPADSAPIALPEGLRILVVDDEGSVRDGMRALLESWGCAVSLASDIAEALASLTASRPDLIIADQRLRGRETGTELIRLARRVDPGLPALLITGDTAADLQARADALGHVLLHKPVLERSLKSAIAANARRAG